MDTFIAWAGFLGAWLLVAGPMYQAALELREQELQRDDIDRLTAGVPQPTPVSHWWWLVPPVKYVLEVRRNRQFRRSVYDTLGPDELIGIVDYTAKATAWLMVGLGGFCLAVKETWELTEHMEWPLWVWLLLVAAASAASLVHAALRIGRAEDIKAKARKRAPAGSTT